jgi:hypothetical protein
MNWLNVYLDPVWVIPGYNWWLISIAAISGEK